MIRHNNQEMIKFIVFKLAKMAKPNKKMRVGIIYQHNKLDKIVQINFKDKRMISKGLLKIQINFNQMNIGTWKWNRTI